MELCPDCPSYVCTGSDCVWRELNFTKTGDTELAEGSIMISRRNNYNKQLNEFLSSGDEGSKTCEQLESQIVLKEDNAFNLSPDNFVLDYEDVRQYVIDIKFSDGGAAFTSVGMGNAVAMRHERMRATDAAILYHHLWLPPQVLAGELTAAGVKGRQPLAKELPRHSWGATDRTRLPTQAT